MTVLNGVIRKNDSDMLTFSGIDLVSRLLKKSNRLVPDLFIYYAQGSIKQHKTRICAAEMAL